MWLNPDSNHELVWDHCMCADTSRGAAVRGLIAKALKGPLAPSQQEVLLLFYVLILCTYTIYKATSQVVFITNFTRYGKDFWNLKKCEFLVHNGYVVIWYFYKVILHMLDNHVYLIILHHRTIFQIACLFSSFFLTM